MPLLLGTSPTGPSSVPRINTDSRHTPPTVRPPRFASEDPETPRRLFASLEVTTPISLILVTIRWISVPVRRARGLGSWWGGDAEGRVQAEAETCFCRGPLRRARCGSRRRSLEGAELTPGQTQHSDPDVAYEDPLSCAPSPLRSCLQPPHMLQLLALGHLVLSLPESTS